jgi:hypothetical protein
MPISRIAIGNPGEASRPDAIRAAFAEFFSMIIFVFAGEGSGMAFSKIPISKTHPFHFNISSLLSGTELEGWATGLEDWVASHNPSIS